MKTKFTFLFKTILMCLFIGIMLCPATSQAQITLYSTDFGSTNGSWPSGLSPSGSGTQWAVNSTSASSGYTSASGSCNVTNGAVNTASLIFNNSLSTVGYTNIKVLWGARMTQYGASPAFYWSTNDGSTWNAVSFADVSNTSTWGLVNGGTAISLPSGAEGATNLQLKWVSGSTATYYRIDDFSITADCSNPAITTQPSNNITACLNTNATFTVATSSSNPTYQWQMSVDGSTGWTNVANGTPTGVSYSNATSATLTVNGSSVVSAYYFRCVVSVTGGCSSNSNSAMLTINAAPSITTNPSNVVLFTGSSTTMDIVATGAGLTYQWQYNNSGSWSNIANGSPAGSIYTNGTTANLTISGILATGNFQYRCLVSSTCTPSATSGAATLTVNLNSSDVWVTTGNTNTNETNNYVGTTDDHDLVIKTHGIERARFLKTGYIGFGTKSPLVNVHIKGITDFSQNPLPEQSAILRIQDSTINNEQGNRNAWWDFISSASNSKLFISTGTGSTTNNVMTLQENGNVSIGTGTGTINNNLEIAHNDVTGSSLALINMTTTSFKNRIIFKQRSAEKWSLGIDPDASEQNKFYIAGGESATTKFLIDENGNVGISTTTALTEKLEVNGYGKFFNGNGFVRIGFNGAHGRIDSDQDLFLNFGTGKDVYIGGEAAYGFSTGDLIARHNAYLASSSGNVGIGSNSTNTYKKLTVMGDVSFINYDDGIHATNTNSFEIIGNNAIPTRRGISIDNDPSGVMNFWIHNWQTSAFNFMRKDDENSPPSTTSLLTILQNGYVGIGTTCPDVMLTVKGTVKAFDEFVIQNTGGWCDYVFDEKYKPMPLDEVENYLKTNKHLPEIPSAVEVEENGVKLMDMNKRLLKKVEEMTLYIIDQEKRIKALESKINSK